MTDQFSIALFGIAEFALSPIASSMSTGVRTALLALLGLLVVIFGCLIAFAFVIRHRPKGESMVSEESRPRRASASRTRDPKACPACRREFDDRLRFCPYDATKLIPAPQMLDRLADKSRPSYVCPECQRAVEGQLRFCPHDGADLIPASESDIHDLEDGLEHDESSHDGAKICPECRGRYAFAASFCGKDGVELVVLN